MFWVEVTFECYEVGMVFSVFSFMFCLETSVREKNWTKTTSAGVMFFFPKVTFQKYLTTAAFKVFFPIVRTRLDIGILKTPYNCRFWFHMDQHRCRSCIWLIIACFSFSQTRLFFKFSLVLIEWFSPEFINIFTFRCSLYLEFHPVPLDFFRDSQQNFVKAQCCFLWRFTVTKWYYIFIFHKTLAHVNSGNYWR